MAGVYAVPIMFNNVAVFFMVFRGHKHDLDRITDCVKDGKGLSVKNDPTVSVDNSVISEDGNEKWVDINTLIVEVNDFRYSLDRSVDAFSWIFSSSAFLGFLGTSLIINQKIKLVRTKNDPWGNVDDKSHIFLMITTWFILFGAFAIMAAQVSNSKNKILKSIRTPFYTQMCIASRAISCGLSDKLTEWHLLNRILNEEWQEFSIFGINIIANMKNLLVVCFTSGIAAFAEII